MKVLIIGATRGIGLQVLEQALAANHDVKVLARSPEKITVNYDRLKVVQGDIIDSQTVSSAIEGRDAVINCIGIMPTRKPVSVFSAGIKNVLAAMGSGRVADKGQSDKLDYCPPRFSDQPPHDRSLPGAHRNFECQSRQNLARRCCPFHFEPIGFFRIPR
jgi:hypothetical protein